VSNTERAPAPDTPRVEVRDMTKRYGSVIAVDEQLAEALDALARGMCHPTHAQAAPC
jgi:hypothetical protein